MLTQKLFACAASLVCQRSIFRRTGHSNRSILADFKNSSSSCKSYAIERIAANRLRYFRRDSSRSFKFTLMASDFCFASRSRPDQRTSIHQNAILVARKGFPLRFGQHHDGIIDAEAIASRLVPNAFARFWRPWKRRCREPTSKGLRQPIVCHHRVCYPASFLKSRRSKIVSHVSSSRSKIGSKTRTSRISPDPSIGGDRCSRPERGSSGHSVPRSNIGVPVGTVKMRFGSPLSCEMPNWVPVPRYVQTSRAVMASIWNLRHAFAVTRLSRRRT
jgi:hypothetical protein